MKAAANHAAPSRLTEVAPAQQPGTELLEQIIQATHVHRHTLADVQCMAENAARSGLFGMTAPQAFVLMMVCEAEGIHPIQAVRRYDIVEGKPSMKAAAMQAEFQRRGGKIKMKVRTAEVCEADFTHPTLQPEPLTIRWTLEELKDSGVAIAKDGGLKKNYRTFPRAMLHARVVSEGVRAVDPGIVVGLYTPEEISDMDEAEPRPTFPPLESPAAEKPDPRSDPDEYGQEPEAFRDWLKWAIESRSLQDSVKPDQAINGVVSRWLEDGMIEASSVEAPNAKGEIVRNRGKVLSMIKAQWENPEERSFLKEDLWTYIDGKALQAQAPAPEPADPKASGLSPVPD